MGILLTILATTLSLLLAPFVLVYSLFRYTTLKSFNQHWFKIAVSIDQFANVWCKHALNDFCIKRRGYMFGQEDETMSSVFGKNKDRGTLTYLGRRISRRLNKLEGSHVEKAIEQDELNDNKNWGK